MKLGNYRDKVELQSLVATVDAIGQPSTAWLTVASPWADIRYQQGLTAIKSGADTSLTKVSIRLRGYRVVSAAQRIKHGATLFGIESVLPDHDKQHVDLVCKVVT